KGAPRRIESSGSRLLRRWHSAVYQPQATWASCRSSPLGKVASDQLFPACFGRRQLRLLCFGSLRKGETHTMEIAVAKRGVYRSEALEVVPDGTLIGPAHA